MHHGQARRSDPGDDDDLRGDRDDDAPASGDGSGDPIGAADDDVDEPGDDSPPASREEHEAFLGHPDTRGRAAQLVRAKVPSGRVDEVTGDCLTRALASARLPRRQSMQPWFD